MDFSNTSYGNYMDFMPLMSIWLASDLPLNCLRLASDPSLTHKLKPTFNQPLHDIWPIPNSHQINSRNLISIDMQFDDVFSLQCSTHCSWLHCKCLKTNNGIISSRNMLYYSENQFPGGGINRDMIQTRYVIYYLNILFLNSTIISQNTNIQFSWYTIIFPWL